MTIETINVTDAAEAFDILGKFAIPNDNIIFRGHGAEIWRLESTLARHVRATPSETSAPTLSIQFAMPACPLRRRGQPA
jgi:hypothetical protein